MNHLLSTELYKIYKTIDLMTNSHWLLVGDCSLIGVFNQLPLLVTFVIY